MSTSLSKGGLWDGPVPSVSRCTRVHCGAQPNLHGFPQFSHTRVKMILSTGNHQGFYCLFKLDGLKQLGYTLITEEQFRFMQKL